MIHPATTRYRVERSTWVTKVLTCMANNEVRVSGLEARYYVRGAYASDINALVLALLESSLSLTSVNNARLAVAAIRGHVQHNPGAVASSFSWHRTLCGTHVAVGRE